MECIENMVKDIYECCKIPFQLSIESLGAYETLEYDDSDQIISKNIKFNGTKCCLKTKAAFGNTLNLLAYSLGKERTVFISERRVDSKEVAVSSFVALGDDTRRFDKGEREIVLTHVQAPIKVLYYYSIIVICIIFY